MCVVSPYKIQPRLNRRRGVPPMSATPQRKFQDQNPKKIHQGSVLHTHLDTNPHHTPPRQAPRTHHRGRRACHRQHTYLLIIYILQPAPHTSLYPKLKISRDFSLTLKRMFVLQYIVNGSTVLESFTFPSKALCNWKKNQLINNRTHTMGSFKIVKL